MSWDWEQLTGRRWIWMVRGRCPQCHLRSRVHRMDCTDKRAIKWRKKTIAKVNKKRSRYA